MSDLEELFAYHLKAAKVPVPEREVRFGGIDGTRRWRFDFCWPDRMIAVEVDGGTWVSGRHTRGAGIENDAAKFSEAAVCGWRVIRATAQMVASGRALVLIEMLMSDNQKKELHV